MGLHQVNIPDEHRPNIIRLGFTRNRGVYSPIWKAWHLCRLPTSLELLGLDVSPIIVVYFCLLTVGVMTGIFWMKGRCTDYFESEQLLDKDFSLLLTSLAAIGSGEN